MTPSGKGARRNGRVPGAEWSQTRAVLRQLALPSGGAARCVQPSMPGPLPARHPIPLCPVCRLAAQRTFPCRLRSSCRHHKAPGLCRPPVAPRCARPGRQQAGVVCPPTVADRGPRGPAFVPARLRPRPDWWTLRSDDDTHRLGGRCPLKATGRKPEPQERQARWPVPAVRPADTLWCRPSVYPDPPIVPRFAVGLFSRRGSPARQAHCGGGGVSAASLPRAQAHRRSRRSMRAGMLPVVQAT